MFSSGYSPHRSVLEILVSFMADQPCQLLLSVADVVSNPGRQS
jgi:hypothetical protein